MAKTAVSLTDPLLERIDSLAEELDWSRSRLIAEAAEEFLRKHENRVLLERLNEVHGAEPAVEENAYRRQVQGHHRRLIKGQW